MARAAVCTSSSWILDWGFEKRGQLFLNEAVEFVEHVGGESVAALHDNLVAADRGHDLLGVNWISMASCAIP